MVMIHRRNLRKSRQPLSPAWKSLLAVASLVTVTAFTLLWKLGSAPIYLWDEARFAMNALEMMSWQSPLVPTFGGEPDLWNTKPPLATWVAAASMHFGGVNELALRIPSAFAAVATTALVFLLTLSVSRSLSAAALAVIILLGTGGFVEPHVARSADPDALLVLFVTAATFSFVRANERISVGKDPAVWIYGTAAGIALAMFTKGVAAFLMVPGYIGGAMLLGTARALLASRAALVSGLALIVLAGSYLAAAAITAPAFVSALWSQDVIGRAFSETNDRPWYYYAVELVWPWQVHVLKELKMVLHTASSFPWSLMLPFAVPLAVTAPDPRTRGAAKLLSCCLLGFLVVISSAAAKQPWYVAPAFPLMAVITALGIRHLAQRLASAPQKFLQLLGRAAIPAAIIGGLSCIAFNISKSEQIIASAPYSRDQRLAYLVREISHNYSDQRIRVVSDAEWTVPAIREGRISGVEAYDGPVNFYVTALRRRGRDVGIVERNYALRTGDVLAGCDLSREMFRGAVLLMKSGACVVLTKA